MTTVSGVPKPGEWPVDPQESISISESRIWIDGCFDFSHHGHAGAMLQARRLGNELVVGVHSDEEIFENKGPTVMTLKERVAAVEACRWSTLSVPYAPYVTSLPWVSHYGCQNVVHGDDITSDSGGEDCYRFVKEAGRFVVVKRTPGISTTDLVGRMLLCTKTHFIKSLRDVLAGKEGPGDGRTLQAQGPEMEQRIKDYATDETGLNPGLPVVFWTSPLADELQGSGTYSRLVGGNEPKPGQRVIYVDGGFDLFSPGHMEFLRQVWKAEQGLGQRSGWYEDSAKRKRVQQWREDYEPMYIVAGVHDDRVINRWKGYNYPIMNIFERGLCVLQCRYVNAVVFGAPFTPYEQYLRGLPFGFPDAVYHGPTAFVPLTYDPYAAAKGLGIFQEIGDHDFQNINAGEIVQRIFKSKELYEERQRKKEQKAVGEEVLRGTG